MLFAELQSWFHLEWITECYSAALSFVKPRCSVCVCKLRFFFFNSFFFSPRFRRNLNSNSNTPNHVSNQLKIKPRRWAMHCSPLLNNPAQNVHHCHVRWINYNGQRILCDCTRTLGHGFFFYNFLLFCRMQKKHQKHEMNWSQAVAQLCEWHAWVWPSGV